MTQSAPETMSGEDILKRIFKEAGVDPSLQLPVGDQLIWYGHPSDPTSPLELRVGQAYPLIAQHTIVGMFHDEDEYRVYTLDLSGKRPGTPKDAMPRCIHFSKKGPTYFAEMVPTIDAFITAMAGDWSLVAYDMQTAERVRIEIAAYIRGTKDDPLPLDALADAIESGEYAEEDDEEPEEAEEAADPPAPTPGASGPGVQ